jgi:cardiolipin synthase (CMP-forming)
MLFNNYFSPHERRLTIPTILTIGRIALTPCIIGLFFFDYWIMGFLLFCLSAITDVLDGFIARRYNQQTKLGACLDPIADKFLVLSLFATLAWAPRFSSIIPQWLVIVVLVKEFLQVIGAVVLFMIDPRMWVRPTFLGKATMVVQVFSLVWFLTSSLCHYPSLFINYIATTAVIVMVIASLLDYARQGWRSLYNSRKNIR